MATSEQCGVDACGYAMIGAIFGAIVAVMLYAMGMGLAAAIIRWTRRPDRSDFRDIFS